MERIVNVADEAICNLRRHKPQKNDRVFLELCARFTGTTVETVRSWINSNQKTNGKTLLRLLTFIDYCEKKLLAEDSDPVSRLRKIVVFEDVDKSQGSLENVLDITKDSLGRYFNGTRRIPQVVEGRINELWEKRRAAIETLESWYKSQLLLICEAGEFEERTASSETITDVGDEAQVGHQDKELQVLASESMRREHLMISVQIAAGVLSLTEWVDYALRYFTPAERLTLRMQIANGEGVPNLTRLMTALCSEESRKGMFPEENRDR